MRKFEVRSDEKIGKFAISTKNLEPGEIFLQEFPFAVGPKPSSRCICLECYRPVDAATGPRCKICSWPLCENCDKIELKKYHKTECKLFSESECKFFNLKDSDGVCLQLDCITPLRVILEKEASPERWENEVKTMEDHREKRIESDTWKVDEQNIVKYLLGPCKLSQRNIDAELIQKILGILVVNAFEAKTLHATYIRCLYPQLAILSHSCVPNTTHSIHPSESFKLIGRATIPISQGAELFDTYTYSLNGIYDRQSHLSKGKYFECTCERCKDPTELKIYFNAIKCSKCKVGYVNPSTGAHSSWKCENCDFTNSSENVQRLFAILQYEIESSKSIEKLESLLTKYENLLHQNHFLMIQIKSTLIEMYGHVKGFALPQLSDELLKRKIELCEDVLSILNTFEPGKSRSRGLIMYEIQSALVFQSESRYLNGELAEDLLVVDLNRAKNILQQSFEILSWEDSNIFPIVDEMKLSLEILDEKIHLSEF